MAEDPKTFSEGKIAPDDEGDILVAVHYEESTDTVRIEFGKAITWLGMNPQKAFEFARLIMSKAGYHVEEAASGFRRQKTDLPQ